MENSKPRTTGLFGGLFDPPHFGHLQIGSALQQFSAVGRVVCLPSPTPPHKEKGSYSAYEHRLAMLRLAIADCNGWELSEIETELPAPHYAIETVATLIERDPEADYTLFIGADQLNQLHTWKEPDRLLTLCRVAVAARPNEVVHTPYASHPRVSICFATDNPISSSQIRHKCAQGMTRAELSQLVPRSVADYIAAHRLYGITK